jgi:regulator of replication initiation timing
MDFFAKLIGYFQLATSVINENKALKEENGALKAALADLQTQYDATMGALNADEAKLAEDAQNLAKLQKALEDFEAAANPPAKDETTETTEDQASTEESV